MEQTVLVVEDSLTIRMQIVSILKGNYRVLEANNGREALEILQNPENTVSAVMTDLVMPEMDGFQFLEIYSKTPEFSNIPVIVSTSDSEYASEAKCLEYGAWDFIKKPYQPQILLFRLKNVIERSELYLIKQIRYQEAFDALTGLYKKKTFVYRTQQMLKDNPGTEFMLLHFDIYRFHLYNNVFGREGGDHLLCHIAELLRNMAKSVKHMTYCRVGGDAFCICIPTVGEETIQQLVERLRRELDRYQRKYYILANLGVFYITDREEPVAAMIEHAKLAAKECKGNYIQTYCIYQRDMSESILEAQNIVSDMSQAMKDGQFVLYLQPKYNLANCSPEGAEVLVRWDSPEKGMISPGSFIPVFEKNGLIMKLDYYVWEESCKLIRCWLDQGIDPLPISVNVSRISLHNLQIVEEICGLTEKYDVPTQLFQLELTESACIDHSETAKKVMSALQRCGFTILMDDFGSGYSSLNSLKDIYVDVLKLDMKFMSAAEGEDQRRSESIVANVVRMAKDLSLPVIAEGVEDARQMEFLYSVGCEYGQGYYFAKPMPVAEYEELAF